MRPPSIAILAVGVFLAGGATRAQADTILFSGSGTGANGVGLTAAALFSISGHTLTVTLRNTGDTSGTTAKDVPSNTLTGVFFNLPAGVSLSPASATIAAGSLLQASTCDIGPCDATTTNVGGEFVYKKGSFPGGAKHGIASSGYMDASITSGNFNGPDLDSPSSPDGINFGIVAPVTASNPFKPNSGAEKSNPLIDGQVVLTLAIGGSLSASQISNVSFQYGTSLSEPLLIGAPATSVGGDSVPEPGTLVLLGPAFVALARRIRAARKARVTSLTTT